MAAIDYSVLYRRSVTGDQLSALRKADLLISAFNLSERVGRVFADCPADRKHWIIQPEYAFADDALPGHPFVYKPTSFNEAEFWSEYFAAAGYPDPGSDLVVDITGFMRPHLMLLVRLLFAHGLRQFRVLYSDPSTYRREERTEFTKGPITVVRQVAGFEGVHSPARGDQDLLIIGTGYDDRLIRFAAEEKIDARKVLLFGLPSLQPSMYQENVLRAARAENSIGKWYDLDPIFAPANDPFVTAQLLHERVERERSAHGAANVYLCPVGTKAQALGFALYYVHEGMGKACSVIFPFAERYDPETTRGVSRVWEFTVEDLPWFM